MSNPPRTKLVKTPGFELSGIYLVLDADTGQRLGTVRRELHGRTRRYRPVSPEGLALAAAQRTLQNAATHVALASQRARR